MGVGPLPTLVLGPRPEGTGPPTGRSGDAAIVQDMCRNITILRGLQPPATAEEIEAAARQYVRKVSGVQKPSARTEEAFDDAVRRIAQATTELLGALPPRQEVPSTTPPLRRIRVAGASTVPG